jgi:hypothetical protein
LTPAQRDRAGAVWYTAKQTVASGFETSFQFQLTQQGGLGRGADGLAFVVQNSGPHAIAGQGASGGFAIGEGAESHETPGIPHSIAVFFDTYRNQEIGDPSDNFLVISTNGSFTEMRWPPARLGLTTALHTKLKDRKVHTARIVYRPPVLTVFLDNRAAPILTSAIDLSVVTDAEGAAWVGFTASTGGGYENHDILNWSFTAGPKPDVSSSMSFVSSNVVFLKTACLPDRNLCTPERATIEEVGYGRYHVILPAHLEWGAAIPNPSARPVSIANSVGTICWDLESRGAEGCNGPAGSAAESAGLLDRARKAGALITKTESGRTFFSVNDRAGNFRDNEGYFEFDVEIRQP